jgi:ribonuclease Z
MMSLSKYEKGDKMHIFLFGSGGPFNNTKRVGSCIGMIAAGEFILIDVGPGSYRNVDLMRLPVSYLSAIFLTHFHSDHIGDLGEANMMSWANGRAKALEIYGPEGVDKVVNGFIMAYELDSGYRVAHHGAETIIPEAGTPISKTILIQDPNEAELFFDRKDLKVYAFEVDHSPVNPAVGYRFEYKGNVVVITGDTKKTKNLAKFCSDADILFCEAISFEMLNTIISGPAKLPERVLKILNDVQDYHMNPVIAAGVAQEAAVKKLVYVHITPPLLTTTQEENYLKGVSEIYDGEVVLGRDNMAFKLKPKK